LLDWLDEHHPSLFRLYYWPKYRLFSRCWACGALMVLHSPWRLYICERSPLAIELTDKGRETIGETIIRVSRAS
jgi:hypothetical protein